MTDLDRTEILSNDESFTENSSNIVTKASLKIISGSEPNIYEINKETIIGRSDPSDLIIDVPSLSKQHAKVTINNGQYFLSDLGSSNKTFQNKVQLQPNVCYALHEGDEIKFGDIICSFHEEKQTNISTETKIDINPSTETITNSNEQQEAIQLMKVSNNNNENDLADIPKQHNGIDESSLVSDPPITTTTNDDDDNQIIDSTSVPLIIEPKELNNDDQLEIVSSPQTTKTNSNQTPIITEIEDTPPNESVINENVQSTDIETFTPSKQINNLDEQMDNASPKLDSKLIEESENITDDTNNQEITKETPVGEQMDTDPTIESPSMCIDDKSLENVNETEAEVVVPVTNTDVMTVDEIEKPNTELPPTTMEQETAPANVNTSLTEPEKKLDEPTPVTMSEDVPSSTADIEENEEEIEESAPTSGRGVARRNVRRARGRRGATVRAPVVSTRLHGRRRNPILPSTINNEGNNTTLEETVSTETEESPKKSTLLSEIEENKPKKNETITPKQESNQTDTTSNVRASARIRERASSGRNRQFPYTDDYVDLDNLEKQSKPNITTTATTSGKTNRGRPSASPQKRINLRQQPIDAFENVEQKDNANVYEQIDTVTENKEPTPKTAGRKRKSITPVSIIAPKRSRPPTPQTVPTVNTRRKQTSVIEQSPTIPKSNRRTIGGQQQAATTTTTTITTATVTPKRGRKSTKLATPTEPSSEQQTSAIDRPVRIALSSHLNFDQNHFDTLRKLGFEIMDESCQVDALVVDRIRRTKKFFMCLARGAHILSPTWIELMIKENRYISYEKYYLEDTNAETRYGFKLRESVQLAKKKPIFENYKFFCTKDTSPPYDDLKDIIEAAGGKLIEKLNINKPGKDLICIVGQIHKNEYEDLFKKGIPIVSEEFILSGISKQKLDFDSFSLFQNSTTIKSNNGK